LDKVSNETLRAAKKLLKEAEANRAKVSTCATP
jgi:hypothetical protein